MYYSLSFALFAAGSSSSTVAGHFGAVPFTSTAGEAPSSFSTLDATEAKTSAGTVIELAWHSLTGDEAGTPTVAVRAGTLSDPEASSFSMAAATTDGVVRSGDGVGAEVVPVGTCGSASGGGAVGFGSDMPVAAVSASELHGSGRLAAIRGEFVGGSSVAVGGIAGGGSMVVVSVTG